MERKERKNFTKIRLHGKKMTFRDVWFIGAAKRVVGEIKNCLIGGGELERSTHNVREEGEGSEGLPVRRTFWGRERSC